MKEKQRRRWLQQHLDVDTRGSFCQVSIGDLVITVQLRTGLPRLRHHLFKKFCIELEESSAPLWYIPMTVEVFLQDCQNHQNLRAETWPAVTLVREKIYSPVENLQHTALYV